MAETALGVARKVTPSTNSNYTSMTSDYDSSYRGKEEAGIIESAFK